MNTKLPIFAWKGKTYGSYNIVTNEIKEGLNYPPTSDAVAKSNNAIKESINELVTTTNAINQNLSGLIIKENNAYTCSSIPPGEDSTDFNFNVHKDGYTPLGVIGISTNYGGGFSVIRYQITGETLYLTVISRYSVEQKNVPFDVTILYAKNI